MADFLFSIIVVIAYILKLLSIIAPYVIAISILIIAYLVYKKQYDILYIPIIAVVISIILLT